MRKRKSKAPMGFNSSIKNVEDLLKNPRELGIIINFLDQALPITIKKRTQRILIQETNSEGGYIDRELGLLEKLGLIEVDWESAQNDERPMRSRRYECRIIDEEGIKKLRRMAEGEKSEYELSGLQSIAKLISQLFDEDSLIQYLVDCGVEEKLLMRFCELEPVGIIYRLLVIFSSTKKENDKKIFSSIVYGIAKPQFHNLDELKAQKFKNRLQATLRAMKKEKVITITKNEGIRWNDLKYPIEGDRQRILFVFRDNNGPLLAKKIASLIHLSEDQVTQDIKGINNIFKKTFKLNKDVPKLMANTRNKGYYINHKDYNIVFLD